MRKDNFFEQKGDSRSKASELLEGILLKCRDEYEEKKISYISKLFENVAFDSSISPDNANQILNAAQLLSYRQLTLIAIIGQNTKNEFGLRPDPYRDGFDETPDLPQEKQFILQDFLALATKGIVQRADNTYMIDIIDVAPGSMKLTFIGNQYFRALSLAEMSFTEFYFLDKITT